MELDQLKREPDGPLSDGFGARLVVALEGCFYATGIVNGFNELSKAVMELLDKQSKVADLVEAARDVTRDPDDPTAVAALRVHLEYFGGAETDGNRRISRLRKDSPDEAL